MAEKFKFKDIFSLLKETFKEWINDDPFYLSAVVAYYTLIALPGLLMIVVKLVGTFWQEAAAKQEIMLQVKEVLGADTATQFETIIERTMSGTDTVMATVLSLATLIFGATGVFFMLQKSLNRVWDVRVNPDSGILRMIKSRAIGLGLIVVLGFFLLVFLLISTAISVLGDWIINNLPEFLFYSVYLIDISLSLIILTFLFATIYKVLPDVEIGWESLWVGSGVTSALFVAGKYALSIYFGNSDPASAYGVAGSMVIILLWVSYSCLLIFFGAEFTQVYARRYAQPIRPARHAHRVKIQKIDLDQ